MSRSRSHALRVLSSAARKARKAGLSAQEVIAAVAAEYGAVFGKEGRIDGWVKPEAELAVRKMPLPERKEPTTEGRPNPDDQPKE